MKTELVCVRAPSSHRRFNRAEGSLGFKPQSYYSFWFSGYFWYLTEADFERIRKYGATRARVDQDKLGRCFPSSRPEFNPNQPYPTP